MGVSFLLHGVYIHRFSFGMGVYSTNKYMVLSLSYNNARTTLKRDCSFAVQGLGLGVCSTRDAIANVLLRRIVTLFRR